MHPIPSKQKNAVRTIDFDCFLLIMRHPIGISEHLVRMKLAEEVEERDWDASIDASSEEDHPSVLILNGLHLEDDQYVPLPLSAWMSIDWKRLGGDLPWTLKGWGCIQHPSK